jgi:hypothetical protein
MDLDKMQKAAIVALGDEKQTKNLMLDSHCHLCFPAIWLLEYFPLAEYSNLLRESRHTPKRVV